MQLGRNRIEALTDGVFAVAMTLLVLDIKVPELQQPLATAELPLKLVALWPKFLSYTISFVILGVYWVGHHVQLSFIRRADRPLWALGRAKTAAKGRFQGSVSVGFRSQEDFGPGAG